MNPVTSVAYYDVAANVPWSELLPLPYAPVALVLSIAFSFWYGYRHPREF